MGGGGGVSIYANIFDHAVLIHRFHKIEFLISDDSWSGHNFFS